MKVLGGLGLLLASSIAVGVLAWLVAGVHDGPLGPLPGGPMEGEVLSETLVDWSFAREEAALALQTARTGRSRTVWLVVEEGALFVPSALAPLKRWPHELRDDPLVVLRLRDMLYLRRAVRVVDPARLEVLWAAVASKYGVDAPDDYERNWIFRMDPLEPNG